MGQNGLNEGVAKLRPTSSWLQDKPLEKAGLSTFTIQTGPVFNQRRRKELLPQQQQAVLAESFYIKPIAAWVPLELAHNQATTSLVSLSDSQSQ